MGQKHKRFREFRTPFPLRDICENPRSNERACAAGDGAICSKNRKIVPYHGANPNTRNGARLRSPSLNMAPGKTHDAVSGCTHRNAWRLCLKKSLFFYNYFTLTIHNASLTYNTKVSIRSCHKFVRGVKYPFTSLTI